MMDVIPARDRKISKVTEKCGAIFMESEAGVLRIIPQKGGIVRVSFSEDGEFDKVQGADYADFSGSIEYRILGTTGSDGTDGEVSGQPGTGTRLEEVSRQPGMGTSDEEVSGQQNQETCKSEIRIVTDEGEVRVNRKTGAVSFCSAKGESLLAERSNKPRELERISLYRTVNTDKAEVEEIVTPDGVKKKVKAADREEYGHAYKTRTYFDFSDDEELIGFGQGEHGEWNLRNSTYYVHQGNRKIGIPMMISSKGYGILYSTSSLLVFSDNGRNAYVQTEADHYLDYYFLFGDDLSQVVRNYRRLTGKVAMLPMWAYGYMQSKERYISQKDILDTADEFKRREIGIDCLVLDWMSWEDNKWGQKSFDASRFPDPKAMTEELHKKGIRFMMSIWPNMAAGTENNAEFKEKGLLLPGTDIYDAFSEEGRELYWSQVERGLLPAGVDAWWCDSSEPITPEWEHQIEPSDNDKYYDYKNDAANIMPLDKANAFGKYHARTIWEGLRNHADEKRVVNLTRSGWAGSQKYGTILWSGDISASWETLKNQVRAGLQFAASGMPYWTLDIGAFFVKHGIQWFWDGDYKNGIDEAYKRLYVRWFEYAAYLPVFRAHGTDIEREPWAFGDCGDKYYEAICETIRNRYRLMPYIYSLGAAAFFDDAMIIRPMMFDFGDDEKAVRISDQFMFGDSIMVCPIVNDDEERALSSDDITGHAGKTVDTRDIYLPKGCGWYELDLTALFDRETSDEDCPCRNKDGEENMNYSCRHYDGGETIHNSSKQYDGGQNMNYFCRQYDGGQNGNYFCKQYDGGQTIHYDCSLDRIPVFVKAGSVIPTKKPLGCTDDMDGENIEVLIFPGADGCFKLYEDAGDGYGYEKGEYCITSLFWNEADKTFSVMTTGDERFRKGEIRAMLIH